MFWVFPGNEEPGTIENRCQILFRIWASFYVKLKINLGLYLCKKASEASKYDNFQSRNFCQIQYPNWISKYLHFFEPLTFSILKKVSKKPFGITPSEDMHFSLRSGPAGPVTLGFKLEFTNSGHFELCLLPYIDLYHS